MPAYIVVSLTPRDPDKMAEYAEKAAATLDAFGGEVLSRGPIVKLNETGTHKAKALISFATEDQALAWYKSDTYQALLPLRDRAMEAEFHLIAEA